jgi:nitroreductase
VSSGGVAISAVVTEAAAPSTPPGPPIVASPPAPRLREGFVDPIFLSRWSRRALSPHPIPPAVMDALFEAARWAPSCFNAQPWLFVFHDDEQTLEKARALIIPKNRVWAGRAPLLVFVFARRFDAASGKPLRTGAFDTGAAWFSLALQAHKLGLSARAMGGIDHEATYEAFGVPREQYESMAAVAVGYPGPASELPAELAARDVPSSRHAASAFAFRGRYQPAG